MSEVSQDEKELQQPEFTPAELEDMTEEERKALTGDDEGGDEDGQKEEDQRKEEAGDGSGGQEKVTSPTTFVPSFQVEAATDVQAKLDDLDKQLEEGDIDIVQYTKQRDPLIQQRTEAELAAKFNQQSAAQLWQYEQNLFFREHAQYRENPALNGALAKVFQGLDTKENAHKTGYELLQEAREEVERQLGIGQGGQAPASAKNETPSVPVKEGKRPAIEKAKFPQTLAKVPIADPNDTSQGEFAHLDNLAGLEYEKALSRLTPDQQDRYLRG